MKNLSYLITDKIDFTSGHNATGLQFQKPGRLRQEDLKFQAILSNLARPSQNKK